MLTSAASSPTFALPTIEPPTSARNASNFSGSGNLIALAGLYNPSTPTCAPSLGTNGTFTLVSKNVLLLPSATTKKLTSVSNPKLLNGNS